MRLLIADDDANIREGLRAIVGLEHDVVAVATNGWEVFSCIEELRPDIVLLDISMPGLSGFKVARRLRRDGCAVKIIFVTEHVEAIYLEEAKRVADGYVLKRHAVTELPEAIRRVGESAAYFPGELV
jgi:DNA-binding NarL/FixJ family response regulator